LAFEIQVDIARYGYDDCDAQLVEGSVRLSDRCDELMLLLEAWNETSQCFIVLANPSVGWKCCHRIGGTSCCIYYCL